PTGEPPKAAPESPTPAPTATAAPQRPPAGNGNAAPTGVASPTPQPSPPRTTPTTAVSPQPTVTPASSPKPTSTPLPVRQKLLCAAKDEQCHRCIQREEQLRAETGPRYDPQCTSIYPWHFVIWQEERLLLLVLIAGAIGANLHAVRSLIAHVGNRNFITSWLVFYYLAPVIGSMMALVAYLAIRGGFFSAEATTDKANTFTFVALGMIAGMFYDNVRQKLLTVAETVFEKMPPAKNALPTGKPIVNAVEPPKVKVKHTDAITL